MTNLEQSLKAAAAPWLDEGSLSPDRSAALAALVRRRHRSRILRRWMGGAATAAAVVLAVLAGPLLVAVASGAPVVGPFIARMARYDEGAHWADQKGYVVPVSKSATDQGYTFRVESVMADSARTVIYYVVEGPDLERLRPFPHPRPRFNLKHPSGGSSGGGELADGRLVGKLEYPPLPTPTALVSLDLTQVGNVAGDWSLSFMASRLELDRLARVIDLNRRLTGSGYDLTVRRVLLAPTQTIVEIEGTVAEGTELRPFATLTVSGTAVKQHNTQYTWGGTVVNHRFAFDRIDPDAAGEAIMTLTGLVQWQEGGLTLDLKPGSRATHGEFSLEFAGIEQVDGKTKVAVRIPWTKENLLKHQDFADWSVLDTEGKRYPAGGSVRDPKDGFALLTFVVEGAVKNPVRLQSGRFAQPVPGEFTVRFPLK